MFSQGLPYSDEMNKWVGGECEQVSQLPGITYNPSWLGDPDPIQKLVPWKFIHKANFLEFHLSARMLMGAGDMEREHYKGLTWKTHGLVWGWRKDRQDSN